MLIFRKPTPPVWSIRSMSPISSSFGIGVKRLSRSRLVILPRQGYEVDCDKNLKQGSAQLRTKALAPKCELAEPIPL